MPTRVTRRFVNCHDELLARQVVKSSSMFAREIGLHRQSVNRILQGDSEATVAMLEAVVDKFGVNPDFLLTGSGEMFIQPESLIAPTIAYVPYKAFAGYSMQFQEEAFLGELQYFSLPDLKFREGTYRCFEIAGDSMLPSFQDGDKVVCSLVYHVYYEQLIKNQGHYVVVSGQDVLLKRVQNSIKTDKTLTLVSENTLYPPIKIAMENVKEVWKVELRLTQDFKTRN